MAGPQQAPGPASVLRGHRWDVQCVTFLPESRLIASGDAEGEVRIWDIEDLRTLHTQRLHDTNAGILQLDTARLPELSVISQGRDGIVKGWRLQDGGVISRDPTFVLETGAFSFCRFSLLQQCNSTQTATQGPSIQQGFDTGSSNQQSAYQQPSPSIDAQQEHPQPTHRGLLFQQLHADTTAQHAAASQPATASAPAAASPANTAEQRAEAMTVEPGRSNPLTAAAAADDADDLDEEAEEQLMLRPGMGATASTSGSTMATGTASVRDRTARTSNSSTVPANTITCSSAAFAAALTGEPSPVPLAAAVAGGPTKQPAEHLAVTGPLLAMAGADPADIGVWELGSSGARQMCVFSQRQQKKHGLCMALQLFQDGTGASPFHVLAGYEDGTIALWDARQPQQYVAAKQLHSESVMTIALSPDCRSGVSGAADEQLAIFKLNPGRGHLEVTKKLPLTKGGVGDVAISGDGRIAAAAGWDGKVRLFHLKRKEPLAVLRYHQAAVACVRFAPGGRVFASGGRDGLLALWDVYPPAAGQ